MGFTYELILLAAYVRNVHIVGRRGQVFQLLARENVNGDQVDLGMAVLASFGGAHVDNLARAVLDDDETVLAQGRTLHRKGERCAGIGAVELKLMLYSSEVSHPTRCCDGSNRLARSHAQRGASGGLVVRGIAESTRRRGGAIAYLRVLVRHPVE